MTTTCGSAVVVLAMAVAMAQATRVTHIQKVIQLMEEMKAKGVSDKKAEQVRFAAFSQFCSDTEEEKTKVIAAAEDTIEKLDAEIGVAASDIEELTADIAELEEDLGRWEKDIKAVKTVREQERTDYLATQLEYDQVVDSLERAMQVLKTSPGKVAQKESMLEEHLKLVAGSKQVPVAARRAIASFLMRAKEDQVPDELSVSNPEAYAYESHSGGVLDMLAELRQRFRGELNDLEKEELNAKNAANQVLQKLHDNIENAEHAADLKKKFRTDRMQEKAKAEGELAETKRSKEEDEKYLTELKSLCMGKTAEFELSQRLRQEELDTLSKAIEIIRGDDVKEELINSTLVVPPAASSLVQLRVSSPAAASNISSPVVRSVISLLHDRARATGSKVLAVAAQKAEANPLLSKVIKMMEDLIQKLLAEQVTEAEVKGWCDTEMSTNEQTRTNKAEAVDELTGDIEKLSVEITRLSDDISDLNADIAELDKTILEAQQERTKEKAANAVTVEDATKASEAVASALALLRDYYAKAGEAVSLVQQTPADDAPEMGPVYQPGGGTQNTVLALLEVIEQDFARLVTGTESAEASAREEFRKFMADSEEDKALKTTEAEHKTENKERAVLALESAKKSLVDTQAELDAALAYYEKLKPKCTGSGIGWEERIKQRNEEIESLKDAYKMLNDGEPIPSIREMKAEQIGRD